MDEEIKIIKYKKCPRCGKLNETLNEYCTSCGFSFKAERALIMSNVRGLLSDLKTAKRNQNLLLELANENRNAFFEYVSTCLSETDEEKIEIKDCLKNAEIKKFNNLESERGLRLYDVTIIVPDDKWDKFCRILKMGTSVRGINSGPFCFIKKAYENTHTPLHESMHYSFRIYHSRMKDYSTSAEQSKYLTVSHNLLNELNSRRINVEKNNDTWDNVALYLFYYYLPMSLDPFPEIKREIKDLKLEELLEYSSKNQVVGHFFYQIMDSCAAMKILEERYFKAVIDRFMIKCRYLNDVINWQTMKPLLDKWQARLEKKREYEMKKLEKEIQEKKEREMKKLEKEIQEKKEREMKKLEKEINETRE
ncbi:MAG: hypothetical protein QXN71_02345 [Candidatus Aenigmatarchaeota archaeon]